MPESLRIALFTHSVNPRGGVVHTLELAEALQGQGQQVTVFAPARPGQQWFRPVRCATRLLPVTTDPGPEHLARSVWARMRALVSAPIEPFDVYHAQDSISGCGLAMRRRLGRLAKPAGDSTVEGGGFVRTVHHLDHFADPRLARWQLRGFRRAAAVLCVSRTWCDRLQREYGVVAHQVDNGVNLGRYRALPDRLSDADEYQRVSRYDEQVARALGIRTDAPVFLAVGGIEARKNPLRMLRAFLRARAWWPPAQLVLVGGASLLPHDECRRQFDTILASAGITAGPDQPVVITGAVADHQMPALLRRADVVLMPSLAEGFGLVVLEALASGTPVVVPQSAPFTEYLLDADLREVVFWCDPLDEESISSAMSGALTAPAFDSPPRVCERFSWQRSARQHLAVYRQLKTSSCASSAVSVPCPR